MQQAASQRPAGSPGLPPRMQAYPAGQPASRRLTIGRPCCTWLPPVPGDRHGRHRAGVTFSRPPADRRGCVTLRPRRVRPLACGAVAGPPLQHRYGTPGAHSRRSVLEQSLRYGPLEAPRTPVSVALAFLPATARPSFSRPELAAGHDRYDSGLWTAPPVLETPDPAITHEDLGACGEERGKEGASRAGAGARSPPAGPAGTACAC